MKKIFATFLLLVVFAGSVFAAQPTATRSNEYRKGHYVVVDNSFTATTGLDTVVILTSGDIAVPTWDLETADSTFFAIQFKTAETTGTSSDWDVLWQVTGESSPVNDAGLDDADVTDWITVETDQNDNSLAWVATFKATAYLGYRIRAVLAEADASADAAVAITARFKYRRN